MQFIQDYVACLDLAMQVATKYDCEIFMPLLLTIYSILTLAFVNVEPIGFVTLELGVFGVFASIKEVALGLFRIKLFIFRKIVVLPNAFHPLTWWEKHE
jgi:hypothetical protein